jgi:hypothetical protein
VAGQVRRAVGMRAEDWSGVVFWNQRVFARFPYLDFW